MITDTPTQPSGLTADSSAMKPKFPTDPAALEARMISEAADHVQTAENAAKSACKHALLAGMRLYWLHKHDVGGGHGGDRFSSVPRGTLIGFRGALEKIGIGKTTAYRWISATVNAAGSIGLSPEYFPEPGTPNWLQLEDILTEMASRMSLRRLVLGSQVDGCEDQRQEHLIASAESGEERAEALLDAVAAGKYTYVQAVRAMGSQEAYDRLRAEGGEKVRRDPVYLKMDGETGALGGLFVTSLTTLKNTFLHWEDTPAPARKAARDLWLALVTSLPGDLKNG